MADEIRDHLTHAAAARIRHLVRMALQDGLKVLGGVLLCRLGPEAGHGEAERKGKKERAKHGYRLSGKIVQKKDGRGREIPRPRNAAQ